MWVSWLNVLCNVVGVVFCVVVNVNGLSDVLYILWV